MTLLPVVSRELRVASRRPWTYWGRVAAAGVALVIATWLMLIRSTFGQQVTGEPIFFAVSGICMAFALSAGALFCADSISREKREGTLGLLFLTDLRGLDITLGKLAASSLGALYGLVAVLPLLALSLLMGGISMMDFFRMIMVLLATMGASLSLGMLASVLTSDVRRSVSLATLGILLLVAGCPLVLWFLDWALTSRGATPEELTWLRQSWLSAASPFVGFYYAHDAVFRTDSHQYLRSLTWVVAVGTVALGLASWRLPHSWQDHGSRGSVHGLSRWMDRVRFRTSDGKSAFRARLLDAAPVAWLSLRHWLRGWLVWGAIWGSLVLCWLMGSGVFGDRWWEPSVGLFLCAGYHLLLKIWIANESPRQFLDDRQSGAMELLLSTSLTVDDVLRGRWLALRRQFLGPLVTVLALDAWFLLQTAFENSPYGMTGGDYELLWTGAACMAILVIDSWAMGWMGLITGLKSSGRAASSSILVRILSLPWMLWLTLVAMIGVLELGARSSGGSLDWLTSFTFFLGSWFSLGVINSLFWGLKARDTLQRSFRELAGAPVRSGRSAWWNPWRRRGGAVAEGQ